jgi:hypothetical protein
MHSSCGALQGFEMTADMMAEIFTEFTRNQSFKQGIPHKETL